eukprot:562992-Prorocentrum_minimum.AAC.1
MVSASAPAVIRSGSRPPVEGSEGVVRGRPQATDVEWYLLQRLRSYDRARGHLWRVVRGRPQATAVE